MEEKVYNPNSFKTTIGGQALIEGVMMRGPSKIAIAVRKPDHEIELKVDELKSLSDRYSILRFPVIRGVFKLIESMVIGTKALTYSASFFEEEEETTEDTSMFLTILASFTIAIVFFMILPNLLTNLFKNMVSSVFLLNLIEGVIRILVFLIYLYYISKLEDIRRVFEYHGSEHKSIHCYESGEELTVENVRKYPRVHPRCGTSFIFMVLIISTIVLSFFGWPNPVMRILTRIILFPIIAGVSYEVNRFIGKSSSGLCKTIAVPGILVQKYFTVREPDDEMIEVAIKSLKAVLPEEGESDLWT